MPLRIIEIESIATHISRELTEKYDKRVKNLELIPTHVTPGKVSVDDLTDYYDQTNDVLTKSEHLSDDDKDNVLNLCNKFSQFMFHATSLSHVVDRVFGNQKHTSGSINPMNVATEIKNNGFAWYYHNAFIKYVRQHNNALIDTIPKVPSWMDIRKAVVIAQIEHTDVEGIVANVMKGLEDGLKES